MDKVKDVINLIGKMVFSLKFLGAFGAMVMLYKAGNVEAMVGVVIAYLAIKSVINASITMKEGEFEYHFVDDDKLNSVICWVLSTKTWIALACGSLLLRAAGVIIDFNWIDTSLVKVADGIISVETMTIQLETLGIAFGAAIGLPEVAGFIKGKIKVKELPQPIPYTPVASPQPQESPFNVPVVVEQPKSKEQQLLNNRPAYIPFMAESFVAKVRDFVGRNLLKDEATQSESFLNMRYSYEIANGERCYYPEQAADFATWYVNQAYINFKEKFGFGWTEIKDHFNDLELLKCPSGDIDGFLFALPDSYKTVYREVADAIGDFQRFTKAYIRLGDYKLSLNFATGLWSLWDAFQVIDELK